jgi:hypothetical protein
MSAEQHVLQGMPVTFASFWYAAGSDETYQPVQDEDERPDSNEHFRVIGRSPARW